METKRDTYCPIPGKTGGCKCDAACEWYGAVDGDPNNGSGCVVWRLALMLDRIVFRLGGLGGP